MSQAMHGIAIALSVVLGGCTVFGDGDVLVRVTGEDAAREGFPFASDEGEVGLQDGWTLTFDTYLVALADVEVASSEGDSAARSDAVYVVDLTADDPVIETLVGLPGQRWDRFSFSVRAPTDGEPVKTAGGADDADVARMRDGAFNYWIEGSASKGDRHVHFAWGLTNPVDARECTNGTDGTSGIVVRANQTAEAEITFHVEHLFWDTLGSEQTRLRFDAIAAMADDEGEIAWSALADQMLTDLRDAEGEPLVDAGGTRVIYDPGSTGLPRNDLQQFILAATRSQAHLNGEGLCRITPR